MAIFHRTQWFTLFHKVWPDTEAHDSYGYLCTTNHGVKRSTAILASPNKSVPITEMLRDISWAFKEKKKLVVAKFAEKKTPNSPCLDANRGWTDCSWLQQIDGCDVQKSFQEELGTSLYPGWAAKHQGTTWEHAALAHLTLSPSLYFLKAFYTWLSLTRLTVKKGKWIPLEGREQGPDFMITVLYSKSKTGKAKKPLSCDPVRKFQANGCLCSLLIVIFKKACGKLWSLPPFINARCI